MGWTYTDGLDLGGSGGLEGVANFAALPPFADHLNESYFVEASQGSRWLPGSFGGDFYPRGVYYSNGSEWLFQENPSQATQAEVNAGIVSDKFVSPSTLQGAGIVSDKNFIFTQAVAANIWNVVHNLNKLPAVTTVDNAGDEVGGEVEHVSINELNIKFNAAFSGKTYVN